ncbi:MAG TPA: hypothetical protein VLE96_01985 [Chlamydiales bacterium]|nr:hypothetical protein [Chlamydiales bacterium]
MKSRTTKRVGIWIFAFTLFMAHLFLRPAHADTGTTWKPIYAKSGECVISFPTPPQMLSQTLDLQEGQKLVYDVYLSPFESKGVFLLLVATYPAELLKGHEIAGVEGLLQGILNHNADNALVFANQIEINGNPAMTFLVQNGQSYFRGQALMVGNKLFLLAMEGKKEFLEEKVFLQFVKSFQLTMKNS